MGTYQMLTLTAFNLLKLFNHPIKICSKFRSKTATRFRRSKRIFANRGLFEISIFAQIYFIITFLLSEFFEHSELPLVQEAIDRATRRYKTYEKKKKKKKNRYL